MRTRKLSSGVVAGIALAVSLAVPAAASADWGAININPDTLQVGVAFDQPSKSVAFREAEQDCPGKCRKVLFVLNKCGAVGITDKGRLVGGFASNKKEAKNEVKSKVKPGGRLLAFVCSG